MFDRDEMLEDVDAIVDEVRDAKAVADWVLVCASANEVHVGGGEHVCIEESLLAEPSSGQIRDLGSGLGDDVDPVLENGDEPADGVPAATIGVDIGAVPKNDVSEFSATRSTSTPPTSTPSAGERTRRRRGFCGRAI